jgi:hypothetical protein
LTFDLAKLLNKPQGLFLPQAFVAAQRAKLAEKRRTAAWGLKKHATQKIQEAFPEHLFTVEVIPESGSLLIDHPLLKDAGVRYFCRYEDYQDGKGVVRLAGEILERVNMHRSELRYYEDYDDPRVQTLAQTQFKAR